MKISIIKSKSGEILMSKSMLKEKISKEIEIAENRKKYLDEVCEYEHYQPNKEIDEFDYHAYNLSKCVYSLSIRPINKSFATIIHDSFYTYHYLHKMNTLHNKSIFSKKHGFDEEIRSTITSQNTVFRKDMAEKDILLFLKAAHFFGLYSFFHLGILDVLKVETLVREFKEEEFYTIDFAELLIKRFGQIPIKFDGIGLDFFIQMPSESKEVIKAIIKITKKQLA